jgi:hypothetical protein
MKRLEDFSKEELIRIITAYDHYVVTYWEDHDEGCYPVCLAEFYDNDYPIIVGEEQ